MMKTVEVSAAVVDAVEKFSAVTNQSTAEVIQEALYDWLTTVGVARVEETRTPRLANVVSIDRLN